MLPSNSSLQPGTCGIHGYHGRAQCPNCSTSTLPFTPLIQSPLVNSPPVSADTIRPSDHDLVVLRNDMDPAPYFRDEQGYYHSLRCRGCRLAALLAVGERDKAEIARLREVVKEAQHRGERDRQHIERLTEALIRLVNYLGAVGAAEDDAIHKLVRQARAVLADKEDAELRWEDLKFDTYSVGGTYTVRVTHLPSGRVETSDDRASLLAAKDEALRRLRGSHD